MANPIELIFVYYIGNTIPINKLIFHLLHLEHNFVGMESVLWCVAFYHFFFPIYPFFFPKSKKSSIRTHFRKMWIFQGFEGKKPCIMRFLPRIKLPEALTKLPDFCKMAKRLESENLITTWSFRVTLGFFVSSSGRFVRGIPLQITEIFNYVIYNTYFWNLERIPDS